MYTYLENISARRMPSPRHTTAPGNAGIFAWAAAALRRRSSPWCLYQIPTNQRMVPHMSDISAKKAMLD